MAPAFPQGLDYLITLAATMKLLRQGVGRSWRIIGQGPHLLVSARFRLPAPFSADFAQGYHVLCFKDLGFPEFTRFFNHGFPWKLQSFTATRSAG